VESEGRFNAEKPSSDDGFSALVKEAVPVQLLTSVALPAYSIDGVIERMETIDRLLPQEDGVAYFNRVYKKVTEEVDQAVRGSVFENVEFLTRLDVVFANRYFEAVGQNARGEKVSGAWAPLFEQRARPQTAPIQFVLAGMNAHINNDLPLSVIDTCRDLALEPHEESPEHRDYTVTNGILATVQSSIKEWFTIGLIASVDKALGKLDDALSMWSIARGREAAWNQAETIWFLSGTPRLHDLYVHNLTRTVGYAGRGILL
jgi:hypothetical protein